MYFTEAPKLPVEDMATLERLWRAYSDGKFGYAVQRQAFESKKANKNFELFFERIGWKNKDGSLLRWLPEAKGDEFIYDLDKARPPHPTPSTAARPTLAEGPESPADRRTPAPASSRRRTLTALAVSIWRQAPKGHLPLTSALRGTQLLQGLLYHEAWDREGARPSTPFHAAAHSPWLVWGCWPACL